MMKLSAALTNFDVRSSKLGKRTLPFFLGICFVSLFSISLFSSAYAIPSFSLLTGTRCSACHFDPQGGGIRNELGWQMMNQTGLLKWRDYASDTTVPTNTMLNGMLVPGFDGRGQLVRVSTTQQEIFIPMQLSTALAFMPSHEVSIYTDIDLATIAERARGGSLYPGQSEFDLAVQYQPSVQLPSIRAGMIEPSIGIRQDDHTVFVNRDAAFSGVYLFPPEYSDVGAEMTYEGLKYLTVNAGIFNASNLSQVDATIGAVKSHFDFAHPTYSARVMLWPQLLDAGINGEFGGSILQNGSFQMLNVFGGFGLADKATFYVEALHAKNSDNRIIRNFTVLGTLHLASWLLADWRYDWGQTELYPGRGLYYAQAFTFGFEFFLLPYIELRPEYLLFQQQPFNGQGTYSAQYTAQLHVFY